MAWIDRELAKANETITYGENQLMLLAVGKKCQDENVASVYAEAIE
jgi:hypothetical protein